MDINDNGPRLTAGDFRLRVTNVGLVGNAFLDVGLSNDPSFEFPAYSGVEYLNYGALWVGAVDAEGNQRVSGGPNLEWRPTLPDEDHVREARRGDLGARRLIDDDGDGRVDEDPPNGRDDDGDGAVDEDFAASADQVMFADYTDDQPAAVNYYYPSGERHQPLELAVHQEAYAWARPGFNRIAGLQFQITNRGKSTLREVYVGFFADLDSRKRSDITGYLNDQVFRRSASAVVQTGRTSATFTGLVVVRSACSDQLGADFVVLSDEVDEARRPSVAVVPLGHTTDPLGLMAEGARYATAPSQVSFRTSIFVNSNNVSQGRAPVLDTERYAALVGAWPEAPEDLRSDYSVLVSCGPFRTLAPGQTVDFAVALVAGATADSLVTSAANALVLYRGMDLNMKPDLAPGDERNQILYGATGTFGHEACVEPPEGITFVADPHCLDNLGDDLIFEQPPPTVYRHGECVWTNADCDYCTGINGNETVAHWINPGDLPPPPTLRVVPGDHRIRIEWDNLPEILIRSGEVGTRESVFLGYRIYRLADWRGREGALPPRGNWSLVAAFSTDPRDSSFGEIPLATVTDSTLDYARILYEQPQYPPGRYAYTDGDVLNGFDYVYAVTCFYELHYADPTGTVRPIRLEGLLTADFRQRASPQSSARADGPRVWVVPNPFRARASWDRPEVSGDVLSRHLDFFGLPRSRCTIKIWTVAGDLVAQIEHDGSQGDGEAAWNLVSRNGQEVESGIYLFSVESPLGSSVGRFVVIR